MRVECDICGIRYDKSENKYCPNCGSPDYTTNFFDDDDEYLEDEMVDHFEDNEGYGDSEATLDAINEFWEEDNEEDKDDTDDTASYGPDIPTW